MEQTIKQQSFESYLIDIHNEIFPEILDDDQPDHFESWLESLDVAEVMEYAEEYGDVMFISGGVSALKQSQS